MSKYTTEVRYICEVNAGLTSSVGCDDVERIIELARPKIFGFDYPIFDPAYKSVLETKILKHYYTREIAHETVGLWRLKLNTKMNEIMPYFNQLYKSELLQFNPLYDTDLTRDKSGSNTKTGSSSENTVQSSTTAGTGKTTNNLTETDTGKITDVETGTNTGTVKNTGTIGDSGTVKSDGTVADDGMTTTGSTDTNSGTNSISKTTTSDKMDKFSDTPQGGVSGLDDGTYLTNARKVDDSSTETETDTFGTSLHKSGTVDANNTTTTDMTNTTNMTKTNNLTMTNDLANTKNSEINKTNTNNKGGTVDVTNNTDFDNTMDITASNSLHDVEAYLEKVSGKAGTTSYSELLQKFRETFLNIDMKVIDELGELFFNLW